MPEPRKTFRSALRRLVPRWLAEGEGELVLYSLGLVIDAAAERARQGLLARFPEHAPEDALGLMGRDRLIIRGFDEAAATYRLRLLGWLDTWRSAGTAYTMLEQVSAYLYPHEVRCKIVTHSGLWYVRESDGSFSYVLPSFPKNWDWDGLTSKWARFWLIIYPPTTLWAPMTWADVPSWTAQETWGGTFTRDQVASIRAIVARFKPAGTRCEKIIIAHDPASFDENGLPGEPLPDGEWRFNRQPHSDPVVPSRIGTARYWMGSRAA